MRALYIITLVSVLSLFFIEQAQAQRYFPGLFGVQVKGGIVDGFSKGKGEKQAYSFGIAFNTYTYSAHQWVFGAEYLEKSHVYKDRFIPIQQYTADAGYYHTLYAIPSKMCYFLIGLSGMVGYEEVNKGKKMLFDGASIESKSAFLGGVAATFEMETFLSDKLILTLTARERVLWGSTTGKFHFQLSAGVRFIIN